jgi:hypothetical protein
MLRAVAIPRERDAVARALPALDAEHRQLARLDLELEEFLAAEPPTSHELVSVGPWVASQIARADALATAYAALSTADRPEIALAAAARAAESYLHLQHELFAIELPDRVRTGSEDKLDEYCEALTASADTLEERARRAIGRCKARSVELGVVATAPSCDFDLEAIR